MRIQERITPARYRGGRKCHVKGCSEVPTGGKPYCGSHVLLNAGAASAAAVVQGLREEAERIRKGKFQDTPMHTEEVLNAAPGTLASDVLKCLSIGYAVGLRYLRYLEKRGLVKLTHISETAYHL